MILDATPFSSAPSSLFQSPAVQKFLAYLERKLGVRVVLDNCTVPYERNDLREALSIADTLYKAGLITTYTHITSPPDEPQLFRWAATCKNTSEHPVGGAHFSNETSAVYAMCGEALERFLWQEATDHFKKTFLANISEMSTRGRYTHPDSFVGASKEMRAQFPQLYYKQDTKWRWVEGVSLTQNDRVFVPAQAVSGNRMIRVHEEKAEPVIRSVITTGAAVWPTQEGARLRALYELIERDAYMIWWLNQIELPRIDLTPLVNESLPLKKILATLARYQLRAHAVKLLTDAPVNAVCVIIEDTTDHAPRFSFGLKAGKKMSSVIEGAIVEALRARVGTRREIETHGEWNTTTPVAEVGHLDRLRYWAHPQNAQQLAKFTTSEFQSPIVSAWEHESNFAHLQRIIAWARAKDYEIAFVSPGASKSNPLPYFCEVAIIPELQPTYLFEKIQYVHGERLQTIPKQSGFLPREKPFTDAPHPFA